MTPVKSIPSGFSPPSPPHHFVRNSLYTSILCFLLTAVPANISFATNNNLDLSDLSLEQLMNLEVITVSRKPEPFGDKAGEDTIFRVYGKYLNRNAGKNTAPLEGDDS